MPSVGEEFSKCFTLISSLQENDEVSIALKIELAHFTRSSAWCQEVTKWAGVEFAEARERAVMIDDDTLKDLLRIDDDLFQVCKWLNESAIPPHRLG